ncbi:hypothetical protein QFC21_001362 [Naganishia friedmannii]|uniref:Uncharacterized protein n=1 Tax=Naganishia friedmannii TaxID=89922 RepID=A0ACC2W484_9TREE|nr:hypothetical protein QFC21_001362 [Naganishia friedmannii]
MEKFTFTVGKLDAGMAILIGERAHLIEFPSILLPPGVSSGSIVNISVNRNQAAENAHLSEFWALQDQILNEYGIDLPVAPELKLRHITQTSVTLEWPHIELAKADIRGLEIYKNGQRLALIPNPKSNTSTKLSSLQSNEEYTFQLVFDTSGISVCFGSIQDPNFLAHSKAALKHMKAKWTESIEIDTTHFVCQAAGPAENNYNPTSEYLKAVQLSLPIVQPQWILACQIEKKLVPVSSFQLGADTPHKYEPQGSLLEEDEHEPRPQTAEAAVAPESKVSETGNVARESSTEVAGKHKDTVTRDVAPAASQSQESGPDIHPEALSQPPGVVTDGSASTEPHQSGTESPPSASRSPKPEADGKLDRAFRFPVSSPPADEKAELGGTEPTTQSDVTPSEGSKATHVDDANAVKEDKPVATEHLVEEPKADNNESAMISQITAEPVSASTEEQPRPEPTTSYPPRPEPKKTESDVDVAARQWLSGQKPVDASGEEENYSSKVLDEVLVNKAAAQAEKEAAAADLTPIQSMEIEEPQQADTTPVIEVRKDHGEVVKVAEASTPPDGALPEATLNLEEPVEDEGEGEEVNDEEDQTPADSAVPTPSESPAPQEGEPPVTGGSKKKKNKKKSKK